MLLTDAGVNIRPTLQRKVEILKNALAVARRLGISSPRAAMLAATEKVNYPAMPATLDADIIAKMAAPASSATLWPGRSLDLACPGRGPGGRHHPSGHADIPAP
jgi:phosphate butyryltransferase